VLCHWGPPSYFLGSNTWVQELSFFLDTELFPTVAYESRGGSEHFFPSSPKPYFFLLKQTTFYCAKFFHFHKKFHKNAIFWKAILSKIDGVCTSTFSKIKFYFIWIFFWSNKKKASKSLHWIQKNKFFKNVLLKLSKLPSPAFNLLCNLQFGDLILVFCNGQLESKFCWNNKQIKNKIMSLMQVNITVLYFQSKKTEITMVDKNFCFHWGNVFQMFFFSNDTPNLFLVFLQNVRLPNETFRSYNPQW
jgi:hypothetical protein